MAKKLKLPKVRNPFVQHLAKTSAGAHGKPYKVKRQKEKVALRKDGDFSIILTAI